MLKLKSSHLARVSTAAYGAVILFAIHLLTYFIPALRDVTTSNSVFGAEALALLAVAEHLILLPVIAALPAPKWARAVGYGWLVLDIATDIMQLNGVVSRVAQWSECCSGPVDRLSLVADKRCGTCDRRDRGTRPCCVLIHCVHSLDLSCARPFSRPASVLVCSRRTSPGTTL